MSRRSFSESLETGLCVDEHLVHLREETVAAGVGCDFQRILRRFAVLWALRCSMTRRKKSSSQDGLRPSRVDSWASARLAVHGIIRAAFRI